MRSFDFKCFSEDIQITTKPKEIIIKSKEKVVTIGLTEEEAKLFLEFQKYYNNFKTLIEGKAFETKSGRAIIHFNSQGTIDAIELQIKTLQRNKNII